MFSKSNYNNSGIFYETCKLLLYQNYINSSFNVSWVTLIFKLLILEYEYDYFIVY